MDRKNAEAAVILAPHGRDASVAASMLHEGGLSATTVPNIQLLAQALENGAGFAVIIEEALRGADLRALSSFIAEQPGWSDFPFIVLTARGGGLERNPDAVRLLEILGNVTFLERPFHPTSLISLARSARRARLRQYEARSRLEAIHEGQERLAELAGSLERQVEERTRESEAAHEQLRQAQKMEAVGQLTGGLAHDFNNMLTGISGSLELIELRIQQGRSDELGKYVEMAQAATKRAAALTHRLLAFSRRQTLDPKPVEVSKLVLGMREFLQRSVGPEIEIETSGPSELWTALLDPNQLENALLNLCINARDAMPDGGRIRINMGNEGLDASSARDRDLPPGEYVRLSVEDTGTGMSPETIARAFDPFYTTKPLGAGTGLGLSMIYGFVRQSGGQVCVESEMGRGTTMTLYFPRAGSENGEPLERGGRQASLPSGEGEVVLVVDDEWAIRSLITDVLGDLGYTALEAGDGAEGLALLNTQPRIDLLITDVGLPNGMNGRQLADAARIDRPNLKVLFITGYAENAVIGNAQLDEGMHVLTKPFALGILANRIREVIAS